METADSEREPVELMPFPFGNPAAIPTLVVTEIAVRHLIRCNHARRLGMPTPSLLEVFEGDSSTDLMVRRALEISRAQNLPGACIHVPVSSVLRWHTLVRKEFETHFAEL